MFPPLPWGGGGCGPNRFLSLCVCVGICISVSVTYYLIAVYLCFCSVKISVPVICYLCIHISLGDAALATIRVLKTGCYCSQNAALQIAQNGLGGAGSWGG